MSSLKENKMGTMPIGRLLLTMALPMALSMLVQALYNVVDSAFVAKISDVNQDALNAVSLAFPVQNIMIGIATGTAVGVNALLSRALGERDADMVNRSALNGVFLAGLGMLLSALFGIFCAELFMRSQTSNEAVIAYGTAYIRIITIASFGIFGEIIFERLLQSTGRTIYTLVTQGTGAVLNIIFDPILIFGLFGLPRIITCEANYDRFLKLVDSPANGLTFCTGSLGASPDNDLVHMAGKYADRIPFLHLRNILRTGDRCFHEVGHPTECGSIDMYGIAKTLVEHGFDGYVRPDHGRMIWGETGRYGYGLYDRALGATYIAGLFEAIEKDRG